MKRSQVWCWFLAAAGAGAQSPPALPEVTNFVQQAIAQQRLAETKERDYVFREDTNDIRLKKECTWAPQCPATPTKDNPSGISFQVLRYAEHNFEVFWLDGVRVARVLPPCDHCKRDAGPDHHLLNIPVSDSELAVENQRVDQEVAEARALRAQGKDASSPDDPPQILLSKLLEACGFSNPRRQVVGGRSTILLDFVCNPSEPLLEFFSGRVGIDEEDRGVQQVAGRFLADVKMDGGNIRIRKGTRMTIQNRRVAPGIWLLESLDALGEGRYFAFRIDGAGHIFGGNYRRFNATGRILP